jgi:pilus assembly protein Flp/PilA
MKKTLSQLHEDESAVTAIEYALLAALIAVVIAVTVGTAGTQVNGLLTYVKDRVVFAVSLAT